MDTRRGVAQGFAGQGDTLGDVLVHVSFVFQERSKFLRVRMGSGFVAALLVNFNGLLDLDVLVTANVIFLGTQRYLDLLRSRHILFVQFLFL